MSKKLSFKTGDEVVLRPDFLTAPGLYTHCAIDQLATEFAEFTVFTVGRDCASGDEWLSLNWEGGHNTFSPSQFMLLDGLDSQKYKRLAEQTAGQVSRLAEAYHLVADVAVPFPKPPKQSCMVYFKTGDDVVRDMWNSAGKMDYLIGTVREITGRFGAYSYEVAAGPEAKEWDTWAVRPETFVVVEGELPK